MIRVHVICEGLTEEMFVNELMQADFISRGIHLIPTQIGKPGHKGGNIQFERLFIDVQNRLLGDESAYCTTFIDYYGLPMKFPGKRDVDAGANIGEKCDAIYRFLNNKLRDKLGDGVMRRFIPYVQMYEFEGLLFSDPDAFAKGIDCPDLSDHFGEIRAEFSTPEMINDSPKTAPSKRIRAVVAGYEKPIMGSLGALEIGLVKIRAECQHFNQWLERLEALSVSGDA